MFSWSWKTLCSPLYDIFPFRHLFSVLFVLIIKPCCIIHIEHLFSLFKSSLQTGMKLMRSVNAGFIKALLGLPTHLCSNSRGFRSWELRHSVSYIHLNSLLTILLKSNFKNKSLYMEYVVLHWWVPYFSIFLWDVLLSKYASSKHHHSLIFTPMLGTYIWNINI